MLQKKNGIGTKMWNLIEKMVRAVFGLIFRLFRIDFSEEQWESLMQFVKFGLVGVFNTVFSYSINALMILLCQRLGILVEGKNYIYLANAVAWVVSVFASFLLNRKFVFELKEGQERSFLRSLLKCYASYFTTGIVLNSLLLKLWVDICGISEFVAPVINLVASIPINFVLNKLWAFKSSDKKNFSNKERYGKL